MIEKTGEFALGKCRSEKYVHHNGDLCHHAIAFGEPEGYDPYPGMPVGGRWK